MKHQNVIDLKGIHKVYKSSGGVQSEVLKGIDLEVPKGDFVAIMGPSGSGKSTLMHIIGLLDRRYEGKYLLDGEDVGSLSNDEAADYRNDKIGFIFQQFNLLKRTTVLQNVLLPTTYHSAPDDELRAIKLLQQVGLEDRLSNRSNQLSGGQVQRVAIARALIMDPSYLLADEPTGNLDSKTAHEVMEVFAKINREGTTIVLITHEDEIAAYANRIIRLRDGEIQTEAKR